MLVAKRSFPKFPGARALFLSNAMDLRMGCRPGSAPWAPNPASASMSSIPCKSSRPASSAWSASSRSLTCKGRAVSSWTKPLRSSRRPPSRLLRWRCPGAINQPLTTGSHNVSHVVTKSTRVVRAADMATKSKLGNRGRCGHLPGQAQVRIARCLRAGQKARVQLQRHADVLMFPIRDFFVATELLLVDIYPSGNLPSTSSLCSP